MAFTLSKRSLGHLEGVHPDLVRFVKRLIEVTPRDFIVIDGLRTLKEQKANVAKGVSKTMNSLHLAQADGYAHAVDIVPIVSGKPSWDSLKAFDELDRAVEQVRAATGIPAQRIGKWDRPHLQLPRGYGVGAPVKPTKPVPKPAAKPVQSVPPKPAPPTPPKPVAPPGFWQRVRRWLST